MTTDSLPKTKGKIAIVDDDLEMQTLLSDFLTTEGHIVVVYSSAQEALAAITENIDRAYQMPGDEFDVVLSDLKMPLMDGLEFTNKLKKICPDLPIIVMTAFGSIDTAIEAMQVGAYQYIVKPFKMAEISINVEKAIEHGKLKRDNILLRQELKQNWSVGGIIGKSSAMQGVFDLIKRVSRVTANVLISGESGTGKELVARAIHNGGSRHIKPFVAINCSAIPESLLESELFGHAKGSFTGAAQRKPGLFEAANGGTLFLDEIGDMNLLLQAKLLRVIQERKIRAVGDTAEREVDVRIITATHKDLKSAIHEGQFREDLYYRLNVIPIIIPPLRQRSEDIPLLATHFLKKYSAANQVNVSGFTKKAMHKLMHFKWEGNVRELENVVERTVVLAQGTYIDEADIPLMETVNPEQFFQKATSDFPTLEELEKRYFQVVIGITGGHKEKSARILGINRRTLYRKEREYGLLDPSFQEELLTNHIQG